MTLDITEISRSLRLSQDLNPLRLFFFEALVSTSGYDPDCARERGSVVLFGFMHQCRGAEFSQRYLDPHLCAKIRCEMPWFTS